MYLYRVERHLLKSVDKHQVTVMLPGHMRKHVQLQPPKESNAPQFNSEIISTNLSIYPDFPCIQYD